MNYLSVMDKKRKELKTVKIGLTHFVKVKSQKEITGVPISTFIEKAIDEKLRKEKQKL